jgi:hypothetical protein
LLGIVDPLADAQASNVQHRKQSEQGQRINYGEQFVISQRLMPRSKQNETPAKWGDSWDVASGWSIAPTGEEPVKSPNSSFAHK